jgi:translocation and assembly module TamB
LLAGLLQSGLPEVEISRLDAAAGWTNGPASFGLELSGSAVPPGRLQTAARLALDFAAAGDPKGLVISNLVLASQTATVARVKGVLPLSLWPGSGTNFLRFETNAPLQLAARAEPRSAFWDELARYTGVTLREPRLEAELSGTWDAPQGILKAGAAALVLSNQTSRPNPNLESLDLVLEMDRGEARLTTGRLLVQGQPVIFAAQLPLEENFWPGLIRGKWPDLTRASGRVKIEDAEVAAFQPVLPKVLVPQGELNLDLVLYPGRHLRGQLSLAHARTRPLEPTGPIRGIFVNLTLEDRTLVLERASASIGAASVNLTGRADLSGEQWLRGELPPFNLSLHGLSVPLARQPEFVIRSDLLLGILKTNGAPPLITGRANLHDSYFLSDLRDLVPGGVASPERRPPYFSIEEPFLADWRLAVDVAGAKFLRLRSPLFNGLITANLKLQGTLKDPIALGDVKIDSGAVRFPFASLQVQQGLVSLTSQDPYHPQLSVNAASKQFGYDIRMSVTGPVDAPIIQFSSTPPLSSEQILLMVSAGELPQGTYNLTPQQRAQTVAMFLGRDLLSKIGVGDEAQQRLTIRSGEQISEQGRPTYRVEYKLSDRWSLTGEYDRFGDYNAGFKWRVYSK